MSRETPRGSYFLDRTGIIPYSPADFSGMLFCAFGQRKTEKMIAYEKELNPEQCRVVMEEGGPLLVIAGAGSGKTRTLTYRVARLVEGGIPPERILLATFTNKAALSMLSRVAALIGREIGRAHV